MHRQQYARAEMIREIALYRGAAETEPDISARRTEPYHFEVAGGQWATIARR